MGPLPGHVRGAAHFTSNNMFRYWGCWNSSRAAAPLPSPFMSLEDCAEAPQLGPTLSSVEEISASASLAKQRDLPQPELGSLLSEQPGHDSTR